MPEIRHYKVTQTRSVRVSANSAADAAVIASEAFKNGVSGIPSLTDRGPKGPWGHTNGPIREEDMRVVSE